jgi:hypothetical protein
VAQGALEKVNADRKKTHPLEEPRSLERFIEMFITAMGGKYSPPPPKPDGLPNQQQLLNEPIYREVFDQFSCHLCGQKFVVQTRMDEAQLKLLPPEAFEEQRSQNIGELRMRHVAQHLRETRP